MFYGSGTVAPLTEHCSVAAVATLQQWIRFPPHQFRFLCASPFAGLQIYPFPSNSLSLSLSRPLRAEKGRTGDLRRLEPDPLL